MSCSLIAVYSCATLGISAADELALNNLAASFQGNAWQVDDQAAVLTAVQKELVKRFKSALKKYLYKIGQGRFCCYCGEVLHEHQGSFDVEHLICKNGRSAVVFHLRNLALACKPCNNTKGTEPVRVLVIDDELDEVSEGSDKYRIVHAHFDTWANHLSVDKYGRVVAIDGPGLSKGSVTLNLCGIHRKNAMALSDHFKVFKGNVEEHDDWLDTYALIAGGADVSRRRKVKRFIRDILRQPSDPAGHELLDLLDPLVGAIT